MILATVLDSAKSLLGFATKGDDSTTSNSLWSDLNLDWVFTMQIPDSLLDGTEDLKCSPRSYSQEMELHLQSTDHQMRTAYLKQALATIPLDVLQSSVYFWGHDNFDIVCTLLSYNGPKFRELLKITPSDKYNYYPGHCKTQLQIEILLEDALTSDLKLQHLTDIILTMIGDPRNGDELDSLYYFYLKLLTQRKGEGYIADRIQASKTALYKDQIEALKKIEDAPLISAALTLI
jgi:hypothetical protein